MEIIAQSAQGMWRIHTKSQMKNCFQVTKLFEPKCREVCIDEEYLQLKTAFFEKEYNLENRGIGMKMVPK